MRLIDIEPANGYDVLDWLVEELELTPHQKDIYVRNFLYGFSDFKFYQDRKKIKTSLWFRLTILLIPFYFISLVIGLILYYLISGKWGFGQRFFEFHSKWLHKLKL